MLTDFSTSNNRNKSMYEIYVDVRISKIFLFIFSPVFSYLGGGNCISTIVFATNWCKLVKILKYVVSLYSQWCSRCDYLFPRAHFPETVRGMDLLGAVNNGNEPNITRYTFFLLQIIVSLKLKEQKIKQQIDRTVTDSTHYSSAQLISITLSSI